MHTHDLRVKIMVKNYQIEIKFYKLLTSFNMTSFFKVLLKYIVQVLSSIFIRAQQMYVLYESIL